MNVEDAAHAIAHDCEGGLEALAVRLGVGARVFNGQVNPNDKGHVLGLVMALRMQQLTGRADILFSMADALGYVCIKQPDVVAGDVAHAISTACAEFGDFVRSIDKMMRDNKVTRNELKKVQKELAEMIAAANALNAIVASKVR